MGVADKDGGWPNQYDHVSDMRHVSEIFEHGCIGVQEVMGVLIGSAVAPIAMCLCWKKTNKWGAITGAVLGQWLGLAAWLIFAKVRLPSATFD